MQGSWAAADLEALAHGARAAADEQARLRRQPGGPASYERELQGRAERAAQQLRELEPRLKPWTPSFVLGRHREERHALERQLGLRSGEPGACAAVYGCCGGARKAATSVLRCCSSSCTRLQPEQLLRPRRCAALFSTNTAVRCLIPTASITRDCMQTCTPRSTAQW